MKKIRSSLQAKVLLIVLGIFLSMGVLDLVIKQYFIYPSFAELELREAESNLERCKSAIDRELYHLDNLNHDWSAWTDTYDYVEDRNEDYEESNLIDDTFVSAGIHLIYIINNENDVVWGKIFDTNLKKEIELNYFDKVRFKKGSLLLKFQEAQSLPEKKNVGIISTDHGPFLISSRPILDSNNQGPSRGTFIMGRFLSEDSLDLLKSQVRVEFQIILPDHDNFQSLSSSIDKNQGYYVQAATDFLMMYVKYLDIDLNPAFIIETNFPRKITQKGFAAVRTSMIVMVCSTIIVLSVFLFFLRTSLLKPISILTKFIANIKENGDFLSRIKIDRSDELGTLSAGVNDMLETLMENANLLIQANLKLQKSSSTDGLTRIPNRRSFDQTYRRDWDLHCREKKPLGLILCDIDFFKLYNDTYGHLKGDQCLKAVAGIIQHSLKRTNDFAARYGGEEFVIILPNTDLEGAMGIAEIIRKNVEDRAIPHESSTVGEYLTLSLGVGSMLPPNNKTPDQFMECVDKALYQSKANGRNQIGVAQT